MGVGGWNCAGRRVRTDLVEVRRLLVLAAETTSIAGVAARDSGDRGLGRVLKKAAGAIIGRAARADEEEAAVGMVLGRRASDWLAEAIALLETAVGEADRDGVVGPPVEVARLHVQRLRLIQERYGERLTAS